MYRAEDTNLSREVAIKVLPEQFTKDPQRLARFEREAKLLASLNHPNIAAIYGFEEADDVRFLAMELVPGETLAERVAKGPVPVEETLEICRQIAEGVEAAHEKGVIHRDLKPANVKVTPEGKVKILDFGLAKAFEEETPVTDISQSPTLTEEMTRAGVILGTAAYMSPEQARGKPVDKRADIFAFGSVLFELLTGNRAFEGETVTDTIASVLKGEPEWDALPPSIPSTIRFLMSRCLQKDPGKRLQHIDGARILIEEALTGETTASAIGLAGAPQPARWRVVLPWSLAGLMAVTAFSLWSPWQTAPSEPSNLKRFTLNLPWRTVPRNAGSTMALSPDGRHFVYVGRRGAGRAEIYHRAMDQPEAAPIGGTEGAGNLFFSPDSQWVGFFADGKLKKVSLTGGAPLTICDVSAIAGASWGPDGNIIFGDQGLFKVSAAGGTPQRITTPDLDKGTNHFQPEILPGGAAVLFTIGRGNIEERGIGVLSLETGEWKVVLEGGSSPRYSPTGHLLYLRYPETLMAVALDLSKFEVTSDPVPVLEGIGLIRGGGAHFALSRDGMLVYSSATSMVDSNLVWVDRQGTERLVTQEKRAYGTPRVSPDGKRVALNIFEDDFLINVWIYDLERHSFSRLTFEGGVNGSPILSPDSKWIVFQSIRDGLASLYRQPPDGSASAEQVTTETRSSQQPSSWSPDGSVLTFTREGDIWILPMDGDGEPRVLIPGGAFAAFSTDGQWLAYVAREEGQLQVYVTRYPEANVKFLISEEGGTEPLWSPNGTELFYRSGDRMMVVSVETKPNFSAAKPTVLFEGSYVIHPRGLHYYDISPDGQRFLMIKEEQTTTAQINVVLNWFEELKRLVPTP